MSISPKKPTSVIILDSNDGTAPFTAALFQRETVTIDSFDAYYRIVMEYLLENDWLAIETVAPLLSLQHDHVNLSFLSHEDVNESMSNRLFVDNLFNDLIVMHLSSAYYVSRKQYCTAYNNHLTMISFFTRELLQKHKDSNAYVPLVGVFCSDLRVLAKACEKDDHELDPEPYIEDTANVIMGLYRTCVSDSRTELYESKKMAIVPLTVELFRVYFETNKMALLKPLIRAVESLNKVFLPLISLSDLVAYNYYLGKKAVMDSDLVVADRALEYAFTYCPEKYIDHKRQVLLYWIPIKMFLGEIPTVELLQEFGLIEFMSIVEGVRDGNLQLFRQGVAINREYLMTAGVYLMFEKLIQMAYVALFKRMVSICGGHKFKIEMFMSLLQFQGEPIESIEDVICILSNLIYRKRINGYMAAAPRYIVLSKIKPFGR